MDKCNETYADGCQLNSEGVFKNYSQYCVAKDRRINQYLYLFLYTNFAALSVGSCILKSDAKNNFDAIVIANGNANNFICGQLIKLWESIRLWLSLKHEEVERIMAEVMLQFLFVSYILKHVVNHSTIGHFSIVFL